MGKTQRRKDNSQTASSSKSAQLIQSNGAGIPFIGPESSGLGLLDFGELASAGCADLAPEFRILLKKLTKRDALTREKAIKEFPELLENASTDQLKLSFGYFAPIYQRLITDANNAIRSASNKLLAKYISRLKKEASNNCLKQTLPFLLFSTADHSNQVVKSATSLLCECFASEKKELVLKNFADDALSLSLSIANRKHRLLLASQQFTDEESNEQRKDRLISQSFNCIDRLSEYSSNLSSLLSTLSALFTNSESLNPFMGLGNNVKISLYRLARKVAERDPHLLIRGKFVAVLLNNLNLTDSSLFQNAFECFLRLAQEDALFEQCSLDKAIVPKLLSLIRRKEGHWELLANTLLPVFSVIFYRIGANCRKKQLKFALSVLDSFFDGDVLYVPFSSWSNSFIEICKFCLVKFWVETEDENEENKSVFLTEYFHKITKFVDFIVNGVPAAEYGKLAEFITWLQLKLTPKTDDFSESAAAVAQYTELEKHLLSLLPKSDNLLDKLLDIQHENAKFNRQLLTPPNSSTISNSLLIKAADSILSSETFSTSHDHLLDIVTLRIQMGGDSFGFDEEIVRLINILCQILMKSAGQKHSIAERIKLDNVWVCLHSVGFVLSDFYELLGHNSLFLALCTIFRNLLQLEAEFGRVKRSLDLALAYICEKCSVAERQQLLRLLPADARLVVQMPNTVNLVFDYLLKKEKVPVPFQHFFVENIFKTLLEASELVNLSAFLMLRQFECNTQTMRDFLLQFLSSKECTIPQIKMMANLCNTIVYFKNATISETFLCTRLDLMSLAQTLDYLFSAELLSSEDQCLLTSFALLRAASPLRFDSASNAIRCPFERLIEYAKFALFYSQFLLVPSETDQKTNDFSSCYVLIVSTFVDHFKFRMNKTKEFQMLLNFSEEFNLLFKDSIPSLDEMANSLLVFITSAENGCFVPFCAFYSLLKFPFRQIPLDGSSIRQIFEIANRMRPNVSSDLGFLLGSLDIGNIKGSKTFAVLRWVAEFEWRSSNLMEENRAEHFVALATFIEEHRKEFEDWLFTVRKDELFKSLFGCVLLKFCAQIVPFLAEVGGPIRDFVNCALITALQNCTETLFAFFDKKEFCFDYAFAMQWLMGHFALNLAVRYENCVRMNRENIDYREITKEWAEFFGPSVTNYIFHWFLHFFTTGQSSLMSPPHFFIKSLCNAIQSTDSDRLIKAEIPQEFVRRWTDPCHYGTFPVEIFAGYSDESLFKLVPTAALFFNPKPEIQFAAASILKGFLFKMFSSENDNALSTDAFDKNSLENGDLSRERPNEQDIGQSLAQESRPMKLPQFFKAVLSFELVSYSHLNESEVDPLLLSWDVLTCFLADLDVLSRVKFCDAFDLKTVSNALAHLFNSLSDPPGHQGVSRIDDLFAVRFNSKLMDRPFDREHFTSSLFFRTLTIVPALVREWHGTLGKMEAKAVSQYTQKYVSHLVIRRELRSLENMKRGRLEVRILSKVREVECIYRLEETAMNLTIILPENYPIEAPKVETGRTIVGRELHRKWLLQLGVFLNGQNGVMSDGILQWKRSIDQHLKGVEECTICMSTVSSTNYQLPRIRCRQCRKKFHGDCLYKWFQSSSKSSCPLCRANFV